jgi:hypothetical protein
MLVVASCGNDTVGETADFQTDWGNGICTTRDESIDCGTMSCAWDCPAEGACRAMCGEAIEETISFRATGSLELSIDDAEADCYLGNVSNSNDDVLEVSYRQNDGVRLSITVTQFAGAGDYNVEGGPIGLVTATFDDAEGRQWGSGACSLAVAARADGGLATVGRHFNCNLWDGPLEHATEFVKIEAEFACSPTALWYWR